MKIYTKAACILIPSLLMLGACSDGREQAIEDSAQAPVDYSEEAEVTVSEPDGQLGVPAESSDQQADAAQQADDTGVLNPPAMNANEANVAADQSFAELDANDDGYLEADEVQDRELLQQQWEQLDNNSDQKLDSSEFAKFEGQEKQ